jgi:hypothetical protein
VTEIVTDIGRALLLLLSAEDHRLPGTSTALRDARKASKTMTKHHFIVVIELLKGADKCQEG